MLDCTSPTPSVETLLHAFLPHKYVDHTHADAILALVDQPEETATQIIKELYGDTFGMRDLLRPISLF
jgi:rhamnose utilization protein RhaD (predicted bifunctional aldolase and dehydrogenase)